MAFRASSYTRDLSKTFPAGPGTGTKPPSSARWLARGMLSPPGLKSALDPAMTQLLPATQGPSGTGGDGVGSPKVCPLRAVTVEWRRLALS